MKHFVKKFSPILLFPAYAFPVFAACEVNGEEVPCDIFWSQYGWIFLLIALISIIGSVFWLWMLIDCLKRDFKDKMLWVILLVFLNILGAILYFFFVKRKK